MSLKEIAKRIPGVRPMVCFIKERQRDMEAIGNLLAERNNHRGSRPVRVGFLCQYIPSWSKIEDIYRLMQKDDRFEPYLICIPSGIERNRLLNPENPENDSHTFCLENGYAEAINARIGKEEWLDLKMLKLDYIFYPRPYNSYLPQCYTTGHVSRYSRICIIMYCMQFSDDILRHCLNRDFMADVYMYYAELPFAGEHHVHSNWVAHKLGLQKTLYHGYPMIEHLYRMKDSGSQSWKFAGGNFRVLWTPRWTTDISVGGSNFFTYYNFLLDYARSHPDVYMLYRPHPLTFSNFIKTGEMTEQEVQEYRDRCEEIPNVQLDQAKAYEATLWNSSVLVCDISSIMYEYLLTGKPMIFCATNMHIRLAPPMLRLLEGCYVVNNQQELADCLEKLRVGNDPLQELRLQIRTELLGSWYDGVCEKIMNTIYTDHVGSTN